MPGEYWVVVFLSLPDHLEPSIEDRHEGSFRSPDSGPKQGGRQNPHAPTGREEGVSAVLDKVAKRHDVPITAVALAYAMQKVSHSVPQTPTLAILISVLDPIHVPNDRR